MLLTGRAFGLKNSLGNGIFPCIWPLNKIRLIASAAILLAAATLGPLLSTLSLAIVYVEPPSPFSTKISSFAVTQVDSDSLGPGILQNISTLPAKVRAFTRTQT